MLVLEVQNIYKTYYGGQQAIKGISFQLEKGECLGLVGESGSGKSTLARCILGIERMDQGDILFSGKSLVQQTTSGLKALQQRMQMVFQNPTASFNSKLTMQESVLEPILCQRRKASFINSTKPRDMAAELLSKVHLSTDFLNRYPRQLSGGQKQLVAIARAISIEPELIVLDEPTASLDVSIQARTLNLLKDLQEELKLTYLFISHDLSAVNFMCKSLLVMQSGELVDQFERQELFAEQRHSYTKTLLSIFDAA